MERIVYAYKIFGMHRFTALQHRPFLGDLDSLYPDHEANSYCVGVENEETYIMYDEIAPIIIKPNQRLNIKYVIQDMYGIRSTARVYPFSATPAYPTNLGKRPSPRGFRGPLHVAAFCHSPFL